MSVTVETTYQSRADFPTFLTADVYSVDAAGNLHVLTQYGTRIALFAAGRWMAARVTPNRDAQGRFAKRGAQ